MSFLYHTLNRFQSPALFLTKHYADAEQAHNAATNYYRVSVAVRKHCNETQLGN